MPERGPVQLLLHFLRLRQAPGWKIGLAVAVVATLGLLPGEESLYQKAKTGLAQSLRQAAWQHALAGEPRSKPWPWDHSTPAVSSVVPRLGLSAAMHCDQDDKTSARISKPAGKTAAIDTRDPHLASDGVGIAEDAERKARADGHVVYTKGLEYADVPVEYEDGLKGTIRIVLTRERRPPATVALARRGFYDGLTFHRVEPGFVVQGGCPRGDATSAYSDSDMSSRPR